MTARKTYLVAAIVYLGLLATIVITYPKNGRQEANQQGQPAVEKLYEAHYFPNRTVIMLKMKIGRKQGLLEEVLSDIKKRYEIEDVILTSAAPTDYLVITILKDPNTPLP